MKNLFYVVITFVLFSACASMKKTLNEVGDSVDKDINAVNKIVEPANKAVSDEHSKIDSIVYDKANPK